jgi:glycosyltransferase involved in cell wall biosynthesis
MKIVHLITCIDLGGAENMVFNLCEYAKNNQPGDELVIYEIHSSNTTYSRQKKQELRSRGVTFKTIGNRYKYISLLVAPFLLLLLLRKEKPSIVHAHTDLPDFVLAMTLRMMSRPAFQIFRTIHNTELWSTHSLAGKLTEASFHDDTIIAVSAAAAKAYQQIRNRYQLKATGKQHMIYNGVPLPTPEPHPFQLDPERINILFAGRLELQKGIDLLLEVLTELPEEWQSKFSFHIAGDGSFRKQVEELVKTRQNIHYYPTVINLSNKLYPFRYVLMPSRFEGLGLLSVEASLAGIPVAACRVAGLEETLPPDWPLWAETPTTGDLFQLLQKMYANDATHGQLQERSAEWVKERFHFDKMGKDYFNLYHSFQKTNG